MTSVIDLQKTVQFIFWENARISEPSQFKLVLFKDQQYVQWNIIQPSKGRTF